MSLDDRDYMRERKLRWDERRGSLRLDDERPRGGPSGPSGPVRWGAIVVALVAVAALCAWWYRSLPTAAAPVPRGQGERAPSGGESTAAEAETEAPVLVGTVTRVIDGDGAEVELSSGPIEVRLHGIDAPERNQPWGEEAAAALRQRIDGREVALEPVTQDQYDRLVAVVYLGDENINAWLVRQGHAWAYRQYLEDPEFCTWEGDARAVWRGLWAQPQEQWKAPWEWRAVERRRRDGFSDYGGESVASCVAAIGKRATPASSSSPAAPQALLSAPPTTGAAAAPSDCRIKGNVGSSGKIYHLPGSPAYEKTRIDESKGERWFCSEQEARDAGWRAPRG